MVRSTLPRWLLHGYLVERWHVLVGLWLAAAAIGTKSIPKCLKIEGPGSPWFVAAKNTAERLNTLAAGPSEVVILADDSVPAKLAALDILIEAEHGLIALRFLQHGQKANMKHAS